MISRLLIMWVSVFTTSFASTVQADEKAPPSFQAILKIAELGPEVLAQITDGPDYTGQDWGVLLQILSRLQQFGHLDFVYPKHHSFPETWLNEGSEQLGEIVEIQGRVVVSEKLAIPNILNERAEQQAIYRCVFKFGTTDTGADRSVTILTTQIPKRWENLRELQEPVRIRGVLVQLARIDGNLMPLILTLHIGWYPDANAPPGQLLLARHGMDVALLDEVVHRQAFVKPGVTRESDAFYSGLLALSKADPRELLKLSKENVVRVAQRWKSKQPKLLQSHLDLETQFKSTTDKEIREALSGKVRQARSMRGLSTTVLRQAEAGQSSVAPMFLQPTDEVGELYIFEGTARRAVRIAVEQHPDIDAYFEVEVFPNESRLLNNQPVVCCVRTLPQGFPLGDQIREPVRIMGVFFKSWRYRSRQLTQERGETTRQRQLYTPVVLGSEPTWLTKTSTKDGDWAFWGGLAFLGVLAVMWTSLAWQNGRDRHARSSRRRAETIDL